MPEDQKIKAPIADHERRLVLSPDDTLQRKREELQDALEQTAIDLDRIRHEVERLEERDRLLRAAIDDITAAIHRLHLKPLQITDASKPQQICHKSAIRPQGHQ